MLPVVECISKTPLKMGGSPVGQVAFASEGAVSSVELQHFRMVTLTLKTDF